MKTHFMYLMDIPGIFAQKVDELALLTAMLILFLFYLENKKYAARVEKEEMLERFLNNS
ncbi:MAG TPA: hypothetical protein VER36_01865 [Flavisolibacter sp.]|nr:hypothetical protein [Flavisolibacter sp.]